MVPKRSHPLRELGALITAKAILMASLVLAVVHTHLSAFAQALIIAVCSAFVTGLFMLVAAWIAVRFAKPMQVSVENVASEVKDMHETVKETAT